MLHTVVKQHPSHLLVVGDFNLPQIDWSAAYCTALDSHHAAHGFLNAIQDCPLFQHVSFPTRYRDGEVPSLLDLVFSNEEGMVTDLKHLPNLGRSDHIVLSFRVALYTVLQDSGQDRLNFNREDFAGLNKLLSEHDWSQLTTLDVDTGYGALKEVINCGISQYIPVSKSSNTKKNIYMNTE